MTQNEPVIFAEYPDHRDALAVLAGELYDALNERFGNDPASVAIIENLLDDIDVWRGSQEEARLRRSLESVDFSNDDLVGHIIGSISWIFRPGGLKAISSVGKLAELFEEAINDCVAAQRSDA